MHSTERPLNFKMVLSQFSTIPSLCAARKVLIVYAHQEPKSFNGALKDTAVRVLTQKGCSVQVSDLYAMDFKATATKEDFLGKCECFLQWRRRLGYGTLLIIIWCRPVNKWAHYSTGILAEIFGQPPTNCNKANSTDFDSWICPQWQKKVRRDPPGGKSWNHGNPIWPPPGFGENEKIVKIDIFICKYCICFSAF